MASPTLVVVAHLSTASPSALTKTISHFDAIASYSRASEPEVYKYTFCMPSTSAPSPTPLPNISASTSLFAIEEYATQAVSDTHLSAPPTQSLIKFFSSADSPLTAAPKIWALEWLASAYFSRDDAQTRAKLSQMGEAGCYIVFATATSASTDGVAQLEKVWRAVVEKTRRDEQFVLSYGLLRDKEDQNVVASIEVYEDESAFGKHCESEEVETLVRTGRELGVRFEYVALQGVLGFMTR